MNSFMSMSKEERTKRLIMTIGGVALREIPTIAGFGTIVTAFFMGPLIEFFNVKFARPFLFGKDNNK